MKKPGKPSPRVVITLTGSRRSLNLAFETLCALVVLLRGAVGFGIACLRGGIDSEQRPDGGRVQSVQARGQVVLATG